MNRAFLCTSPETGNWQVAIFNLPSGKLPGRKLKINMLNNDKKHLDERISPKYLFRLKRINLLYISLYLWFESFYCRGLTILFAHSNFNAFISAKTISAIFRAPNSLKCVISSTSFG